MEVGDGGRGWRQGMPTCCQPPKTAVCIKKELREGGEPVSIHKPVAKLRSRAASSAAPGITASSPSALVLADLDEGEGEDEDEG